MKTYTYNNDEYSDLELDLCSVHKLSEESEDISPEYEEIKNFFREKYPHLKEGEDYEFPDWHNNLRMIWIYIHSDSFYNKQLTVNIKDILSAMKEPWFAQLECYSPLLKSNELPGGFVGWMILHKDSVIFSSAKTWETIKPKIII